MNADVLTAEQRRENMRRVRGRDTKPEMVVRRGLHARGLRYCLHDATLPGRPDLVFPRYRTVAFIHGCFWHLHGCAISTVPNTRHDFWLKKLSGNARRDRKSIDVLQAEGWRVLVIWECALRGPNRRAISDVLAASETFIRSGEGSLMHLAGRNAAS